ncbi:MAG: hypothetical protein HKN28_06590 [Alphaproteobacteria bacterium]|nr:hypothetical protein [Alphaproteobacteria bacterium]
MTGVCFHFDAEERDESALEAWRAIAPLAGDIDTVAVIHHSMEPIYDPDDPIGLCLYANVNQFIDDHGDRSMVHVDTSVGRYMGSVPLWQFHHDIDWYLFGRNGDANPEVASIISMPQPSKAKLPVTLIASTVLLHRHWVKRGGVD